MCLLLVCLSSSADFCPLAQSVFYPLTSVVVFLSFTFLHWEQFYHNQSNGKSNVLFSLFGDWYYCTSSQSVLSNRLISQKSRPQDVQIHHSESSIQPSRVISLFIMRQNIEVKPICIFWNYLKTLRVCLHSQQYSEWGCQFWNVTYPVANQHVCLKFE